jgi:very-short-patch-repair endonuclease
MQGKSEERDAKLAILASRQHGVVAYWQLIRLRFTEGAIEHRLRKGLLHRLHRGVYAVGHPGVSREGQLMAAVLTCGPDAVLSHWSAAELWRLLKSRASLIAVSAPTYHEAADGVKPHWVAEIDPRERTIRDGIPVTTVTRTLLDLAAVAPFKQLQRAANEAERGGWLSERAITETLKRHRGRKGIKAFRAVIASLDPQARRSRSDLELAFLAFCRRHGIRPPVLNGEVEGYEVDFHWPGTKLIVELDTWDYHGTSHTFETDRERDSYLAGAGYVVIRVTARRLKTDPEGLAATIRKLLRT